MKISLVLILISILLPLVANAQTSRLLGDMDGDGAYTVFDLLGMLGHLYQAIPYIDYADIDTDSDNDITDLLLLLKIIVDENPEPKPFEYALIMENIRVHDYASVSLVQWSSESSAQNNLDYRIYSNHELTEIELNFNGDTFDIESGTLPALYDKDTINIYLDTIKYYEPFENDSSFYVDMKVYSIDSIPWSIKLVNMEGETLEDFGYINHRFMFNVIADPSWPAIGNDIDFPLVLRGKDQIYSFHTEYDVDSIAVVDLNPQKLQTVVYPDVECLCLAINANSRHSNPSRYERINAMPVIDFFTGLRVNRLAMVFLNFGGVPPPNPVNGNERLLDKLGFPKWRREMVFYYDYRYRADMEWYEENY